MRRVEKLVQRVQLAVYLCWARRATDAEVAVPLAGRLRAEDARRDRGTGTGERDKGDGGLRVFHCQRQRHAELVAVQGPMAGGTHPECTLLCPVCSVVGVVGIDARTVAAVAGTVWPVI